MIMKIGIVAGDIWHYLDDKEEVALDDLVKGVDKSREHVLMSLGWLAREGHVNIDDQNEFKVTLRR